MELPISSKYRSRPDDPVPEAERRQLGERLNDAYARGELGTEEFNRHLDAIMGARRLGDLVSAVEALGKPDTYAEPDIVRQDTALAPGETGEIATPGKRAQLAVVGAIVGLAVVIVLIVALMVLL